MTSFQIENSAAILDALNCLNFSSVGIDAQPLIEVFQEMLGEADGNAVTEFLCHISADEIPVLVEQIASSIPWDALMFCDSVFEKSVIHKCVQDEIAAYISHRPFTFQSDLCIDDDHYNQWYAELFPSDFLMEKLEKKLLAKKPNTQVCKDPSPEFYAIYDLIKGTVSILSRCIVDQPPNRRSETVSVPLASREADLLISCIENACRQHNSGKDCLSVINEERNRVGIAPLKQALSGRIRFMQNIDSSSIGESTLEPFLGR